MEELPIAGVGAPVSPHMRAPARRRGEEVAHEQEPKSDNQLVKMLK